MRYRSDIDGLRAVAVLSVVLYHLGFSERIGGGFVGVDVFFVISGYLITGILQKDVAEGRPGIAEFYQRRVRRIFPALFAVQLFCLAAAALLLFPSEVKDTGRGVLWSLAFLSNVAFREMGDYFDNEAKVAPLLHTWSLSVEEQFYIVFPLLLFALRRVTPRVRIGVLGGCAVASGIAAEWMVRIDASRAFYLVQYRAWELLLGSLLALGAFPVVRKRAVAEVIGVTGLALVLLGVFAIRSTTLFPGLWALPPCLGALGILHSGSSVNTGVSRLLGVRPLRFVGKVSYSFYLWHWPMIALWNARAEPQTAWHRGLLLLLSFGAAVASQRWVEQPFRQKPYRHDARGTLKVAAFGMAAVAALAVGVPAAAGLLRPSTERADAALAYLKYSAEKPMRVGSCFLTAAYGKFAYFQKDVCLALRNDRKNVLLMGDSHAAHLWPGFHTVRPDINFLQATASGCSALHGTGGDPRCTQTLAFVFDKFLPAHHLDAVFLSGRWVAANLGPLRKTVAYVRPFADRVVVLGPIVEYDQPLPRLLADSILAGDPNLPARHRRAGPRVADRALAAGLRTSGIEYQSMYDAVCPGDDCALWAERTVPLQFDYGHLTAPGAELVVRRLERALFH